MTSETPALIALVATAVIVDGERRVIQPGELLPPMSPAHGAELVSMSAAIPGNAAPVGNASEIDPAPATQDTDAAPGPSLVDTVPADTAATDASAEPAPRRKR